MSGPSMKELTKGVLAVCIGVLLVFAPYSLLIGWNLITLFLFWFVIVPWIAIYLPTKVSRSKNHQLESLLGLTMFYAFMVFMIYDHYKSDYFLTMMISCVINFAVMSAISLTWKGRAQTV